MFLFWHLQLGSGRVCLHTFVCPTNENPTLKLLLEPSRTGIERPPIPLCLACHHWFLQRWCQETILEGQPTRGHKAFPESTCTWLACAVAGFDPSRAKNKEARAFVCLRAIMKDIFKVSWKQTSSRMPPSPGAAAALSATWHLIVQMRHISSPWSCAAWPCKPVFPFGVVPFYEIINGTVKIVRKQNSIRRPLKYNHEWGTSKSPL